MSIIKSLATSLNRRHEVPNQELAQRIADSNDEEAVKELITNLTNKSKNIQSDCIKVLYEIGKCKPALIAGYIKEFLTLTERKDNRLVWGAMIALDYISATNPTGIYKHLTKILDVAEKGSVITKDHAVNILINLAANKAYTGNTLVLLLDQLKTCATNQLPMYAERAIPVIVTKYRQDFMNVLTSRLDDMDKETKRKRVEKVIKKLG